MILGVGYSCEKKIVTKSELRFQWERTNISESQRNTQLPGCLKPKLPLSNNSVYCIFLYTKYTLISKTNVHCCTFSVSFISGVLFLCTVESKF